MSAGSQPAASGWYNIGGPGHIHRLMHTLERGPSMRPEFKTFWLMLGLLMVLAACARTPVTGDELLPATAASTPTPEVTAFPTVTPAPTSPPTPATPLPPIQKYSLLVDK